MTEIDTMTIIYFNLIDMAIKVKNLTMISYNNLLENGQNVTLTSYNNLMEKGQNLALTSYGCLNDLDLPQKMSGIFNKLNENERYKDLIDVGVFIMFLFCVLFVMKITARKSYVITPPKYLKKVKSKIRVKLPKKLKNKTKDEKRRRLRYKKMVETNIKCVKTIASLKLFNTFLKERLYNISMIVDLDDRAAKRLGMIKAEIMKKFRMKRDTLSWARSFAS